MLPEQVIRYDKEYEFDFPRQELIRRLQDLNLEFFAAEYGIRSDGELIDTYSAVLDKEICTSPGGRLKLTAYSRSAEQSTLLLQTITYNCDSRLSGDQQRLLEEFEKRIAARLRVPK